jgi:hypothetical protein
MEDKQWIDAIKVDLFKSSKKAIIIKSSIMEVVLANGWPDGVVFASVEKAGAVRVMVPREFATIDGLHRDITYINLNDAVITRIYEPEDSGYNPYHFMEALKVSRYHRIQGMSDEGKEPVLRKLSEVCGKDVKKYLFERKCTGCDMVVPSGLSPGYEAEYLMTALCPRCQDNAMQRDIGRLM